MILLLIWFLWFTNGLFIGWLYNQKYADHWTLIIPVVVMMVLGFALGWTFPIALISFGGAFVGFSLFNLVRLLR